MVIFHSYVSLPEGIHYKSNAEPLVISTNLLIVWDPFPAIVACLKQVGLLMQFHDFSMLSNGYL